MTLLGRVPGILKRAFGQGAISWRAAIGSGTYAAFTEAIEDNRRTILGYDEDRRRECEQQECEITMPSTEQALAYGYQVKTSDDLEWAVFQVHDNAAVGFRRYTIRRDPSKAIGPNRGHAT